MDLDNNRLSALEIVDKMREAAGGMVALAGALSPVPLQRKHARTLYNSLKNSANAGHLPKNRMDEIKAFCLMHRIPCDKEHFVTDAARQRLEKLKAEVDGAAA